MNTRKSFMSRYHQFYSVWFCKANSNWLFRAHWPIASRHTTLRFSMKNFMSEMCACSSNNSRTSLQEMKICMTRKRRRDSWMRMNMSRNRGSRRSVMMSNTTDVISNRSTSNSNHNLNNLNNNEANLKLPNNQPNQLLHKNLNP